MKTRVMMIAVLVTLIMGTSAAQDIQKRFGFELSGGASLATTEPGGTELNPGYGFEGILHCRILKYTGIYGGWGWNRFGADESFAGSNISFEETGYIIGVQHKQPVGKSPLSVYLRAGLLYNHIEIENKEGDITHDTGHGPGFQIAAGIDYPLGKNWSITPGIKFNSLSNETIREGDTTEIDHSYLSLRIGILKRF